MTVKRYTRKELEPIVSGLIGEPVKLTPIGNHDLRRHLVYQLTRANGHTYVFKYYYQNNYAGREIAALKHLVNQDLPVPKIIDYGTFDDNRDWLLMEHIEGIPMMKILRHISTENQLKLFTDMGKILRAIHQNTFDFFGDWDAQSTNLCGFKGINDAIHHKMTRIREKIASGNLPEQATLMVAQTYLLDHMTCLDAVIAPRLCHQDFDARNILVKRINGSYQIVALLDFEHSMPWDHYADFSQLYLKHFAENPELEVAFFQGYEASVRTDASFTCRFRFHLVYFCLAACTWAFDVAPEFYQQCLTALKKTLASEGINS